MFHQINFFIISPDLCVNTTSVDNDTLDETLDAFDENNDAFDENSKSFMIFLNSMIFENNLYF